ncbi:MAG: hypothetical protein ACI8WB_003196 [Phenylobacterium sp.]|jgi:hypothetical protein
MKLESRHLTTILQRVGSSQVIVVEAILGRKPQKPLLSWTMLSIRQIVIIHLYLTAAVQIDKLSAITYVNRYFFNRAFNVYLDELLAVSQQ